MDRSQGVWGIWNPCQISRNLRQAHPGPQAQAEGKNEPSPGAAVESKRPRETMGGRGGEGCMTSLQFTDFRQQVPGKALPARSREERSLGPEGGPEDGMEFSTLITLDSRSATGVSSLHLLPTLLSAANSRPSLTCGGPRAHPHGRNSAAPCFLSSLFPPWSSALHKFALFQVTCHPSTAFLALRQSAD